MKYNADDHSFGIVVEVGPKPILSKLAQSLWQRAEIQADPLWIASLEKEKLLSLISSSGYVLPRGVLGRVAGGGPGDAARHLGLFFSSVEFDCRHKEVKVHARGGEWEVAITGAAQRSFLR